jgi:hypothetical protein
MGMDKGVYIAIIMSMAREVSTGIIIETVQMCLYRHYGHGHTGLYT